MKRIVKAEWLDELPANDFLAGQSRRDIQRLNLISGHHRIMARVLQQPLARNNPARVVELGAGNGHFLLSVARQLPSRSRTVNAVLVDRANGFDSKILSELRHLGWDVTFEIADASDWLRRAANKPTPCQIIITNQFLHQFQPDALAEMFRLVANSADVLIALEPRRSWFPLLCSHGAGLVGCGPVTRYDAPLSVRAGFNGGELSALWPDQKTWALSERSAGWFTHVFIAERKI